MNSSSGETKLKKPMALNGTEIFPLVVWRRFLLICAWKKQTLSKKIFFFLSKFPFNAVLKKPHEHHLLKVATLLPTAPCHCLYFSTLSLQGKVDKGKLVI